MERSANREQILMLLRLRLNRIIKFEQELPGDKLEVKSIIEDLRQRIESDILRSLRQPP